MLRETTDLESFPVHTVVDESDVQDLSPCRRRYTFGATCDVTKYRHSGATPNLNSNSNSDLWFPSEVTAPKRPQVGYRSYNSSPHHGTPSSLFMSASGQGIVSTSAFVETDENRMLTSSSSSSSSPPTSMIAVHHRAPVGARQRPSSAAGVVRLVTAARPTDLDLRSTVLDDDGQYRRRTSSMPTGGGGGGQLHGHGGVVTVSSAAARSAACRRAYTRKLRDEQLQQQQQQRSSGDKATSGDGGGHSGTSSAGFEGLTEYVRVRSFSTSSRGVKNRGDSFKRRIVVPAIGTRSSLSSSSSALATSTSAESSGRNCQHQQPSSLGTSLSLSGLSVTKAFIDEGGRCVGVERQLVGYDERMDDGGRIRVTVIGDPDVGKISIVRQMTTSEYMHGKMDSSLANDDGDEQTVAVLVDNEESTLMFVVQSSIVLQPQQLVSDETSVPFSDCYCVVYSVADRATFNSAVLTLSLLNRRLGTDVMARCTACILVGNKSDLVRHRQVDEDEGKAVAARYRCKFVEVSAVLNYKIDELLVGIVTQIRLKRRRHRCSKTTPSGPAAPVDCEAVSGCYRQARGVVNMLFGKHQKRRLFRSCDNLLSL